MIQLTTPLATIGTEEISSLKHAAVIAERKRARICLHDNHEDPVQQMLIALRRESYVQPLRQNGKRKSYCVVEGAIVLAFFDDLGELIEK